MRTTLFVWAEKEGISLSELARRLGYSERHLLRIRDGDYPVNEQFAGRVVLRLGDWARALFLPASSVASDEMDTASDTGGDDAGDE
jgi:hypothetical protein